MSESLLTKPSNHKPLLSLNIRNVNLLFPGLREGDFAIVYGSRSVTSLASLLCVRAQLPNQLGGLNSNVVFIDCGNTFRLYQTANIAKVYGLNSSQVLDRIYISRAFTAYQVTALIMHRLREAVKKFNVKLVIIADIAGLFLDADITEKESQRIFNQITMYLNNFAKTNQIIIVATCLPRLAQKRNLNFQNMAIAEANVVLSLKQTKHTRTIALEKHYCLELDSTELPSENIKLTNFIEGDL